MFTSRWRRPKNPKFRRLKNESRARIATQAFEHSAPGSRAFQQIWIRGDIRAGRTEMQRQAMMLRIMRDVAHIASAKEESTQSLSRYATLLHQR
jgi:hypothetical protein